MKMFFGLVACFSLGSSVVLVAAVQPAWARNGDTSVSIRCKSPCDANICGGNKGCKCTKLGNQHVCEQNQNGEPVPQ